MKKIFSYILLLFITLIITFSTVLIPKTIHNKQEMAAVQFGYPISFITQDLTAHDPPFPWKYSMSSVWENSFKFNLMNLLLSYLTILFVFVGAGMVIQRNLAKKD